MSSPISASTVTATRSLIPGMVRSRSRGRLERFDGFADLGGDLGNVGGELVDDLQVQPNQERVMGGERPVRATVSC